MKKSDANLPKWNLGLLYASWNDPQIEKDMAELESLCSGFAAKYDVPDKKYIRDATTLAEALSDFETIIAKSDAKPLLYFYYLKDIEANNPVAMSQLSLIQTRISKCENTVAFFRISLGTTTGKIQRQFLSHPRLARYKVFLERIFSDAQYTLSVPEERIMNLKVLPAYEMWVRSNEKMLNSRPIVWKKKRISLARTLALLENETDRNERGRMAGALAEALKAVAPMSEAEINAIVTNKKIDDDIRGFSSPYEGTVLQYRNDPAVIKKLVDTVTSSFGIAHRFFRVKAQLMKMKRLEYADRLAKIGTVNSKFTFRHSMDVLKDCFGRLNPKFASYMDTYVEKGQIDAPPRLGKRSGAYCSGAYSCPTFVLLNHNDDFHSFTTMAHELGHAFHGELSRSQGPLYAEYSMSLAETASTLFESLAREEVSRELTDREKVVSLHDKISNDVATIFRQIACFNFEEEIHRTIREKGFMSKEDLSAAHNRHMSAYLGPLFRFTPDDGYYFVQWSHIRRFFYVYSYAYGMLVSKALLRRYREDNSFWSQIETFLSAGGKDSPEAILREIDIDVRSSGFFAEGLAEIEDDIARLEELVSNGKWKR